MRRVPTDSAKGEFTIDRHDKGLRRWTAYGPYPRARPRCLRRFLCSPSRRERVRVRERRHHRPAAATTAPPPPRRRRHHRAATTAPPPRRTSTPMIRANAPIDDLTIHRARDFGRALPIAVPARFMRVRYDGARYPGAAGARGLGAGANCQRFAYEMLRHFGREIPDFRSSELWTDARFTKRVTRMRPLDLLLFNRTRRAWGAHVAVYLGRGRAIHLCKALGRPAIWSLGEFAQCDRYRVFLGVKRARGVSGSMRSRSSERPARIRSGAR
jgi:hypothetical protein